MRVCFRVAFCLLFVTTSWLFAAEKYQPTWESLSKHKVPEWFLDAKFGIYTHWGPITVASEDGPPGSQWYGRNMYMKDSPVFEYHRKKFGPQEKFGYKDIIPLFKAEKFDPEKWAELFKKAGARFAGPAVIHHDNFAMWDSALTKWDCVDMGPKRDVTGELEKAIRRRGMKFIATFHHGFSWQYFEPAYQYDAADPKYASLYHRPHKPGDPPSKEFLEDFLAKVNEVVEKYQPDMIWFDFGLGRVVTPEYQKRMFADYYNWAERNGREVCVAHKHENIHKYTGVLDFERGREDRLTPYPWLTDTSIGPWFHQKCVPYRSANELIDLLVDIVSKNGCLLLNVGPAADGTIPAEAERLLLEIGKWLQVNGEAIYETRPWLTYGEGPTKMEKRGVFSERHDRPYTSEDLRFTRSKDGKAVYVIALEWPGKQLAPKSMRVDAVDPQAEVKLLGYDKPLSFSVNESGKLVVDLSGIEPQQLKCQYAYAFRLRGFKLSLADSK